MIQLPWIYQFLLIEKEEHLISLFQHVCANQMKQRYGNMSIAKRRYYFVLDAKNKINKFFLILLN